MKIRDILKHFVWTIQTARSWKEIHALFVDLFNHESWIYFSNDDLIVEQKKKEYQKELETKGIRFI